MATSSASPRTTLARPVEPLADQIRRAAMHGALGEPIRLAIVEDLACSDRSPGELASRFGLATNLVAHHLDVLTAAGLIERFTSSGDKRRRYVRLSLPAAFDVLGQLRPAIGGPVGRVLFVCSANSARSQLAAALWRARLGGEADSAGTEPADAVNPGAVAAAGRVGLDLAGARPRLLEPGESADVVITVCDRAHEELTPGADWWHWSTPDPVAPSPAARTVSPAFDVGDAFDSRDAFVHAVAQLDRRIRAVADLVPLQEAS